VPPGGKAPTIYQTSKIVAKSRLTSQGGVSTSPGRGLREENDVQPSVRVLGAV
jgi:hypothetical protein